MERVDVDEDHVEVAMAMGITHPLYPTFKFNIYQKNFDVVDFSLHSTNQADSVVIGVVLFSTCRKK